MTTHCIVRDQTARLHKTGSRATWFARIACIAATSVALAACGSDSSVDEPSGDTATEQTGVVSTESNAGDSPSADEPIRIGHVADYSGDYSFYDVPMRDGAQYAIDEINAAGGLLGRQLELVTVDARNDQATTARRTEELADDGVNYFIGTTGDAFLSQGTVACEAEIPISTGDGTAPTLVGDAGDCAFQLVMSDNLQAAAAAELALTRGFETAYVLASPDVDYTKFLPEYFIDAFEHGGGEVTGQGTYTILSGDYSVLVTEIAGVEPAPDVIFTPMFIPDSPVFLRQLRQAGVTIPVISADGNHDPSLLDAGEAVDGLLFTTHAFPAEGTRLAEFFDAVAERDGAPPSSVVFALGYDEIKLLASVIQAKDSAEPAQIIDGLATAPPFEGVTGAIVMKPDTRRADKTVAVVTVTGGEMSFVEQIAPTYVPDVD